MCAKCLCNCVFTLVFISLRSNRLWHPERQRGIDSERQQNSVYGIEINKNKLRELGLCILKVQKTFVIYIFDQQNNWIVVIEVLQYIYDRNRVLSHNYLNSIAALYCWRSSPSLYISLSLVIVLRLQIFKLLLNY